MTILRDLSAVLLAVALPLLSPFGFYALYHIIRILGRAL